VKRATIHLVCDGQPVDFEIHDDGKVVVPGYDLETEMAAVELGFEASECLKFFDRLHDDMFGILGYHRVLTPLLQYSRGFLKVSTAHMSAADDGLLGEDRVGNNTTELAGHELYYRPTETGWHFELSPGDSPVDLVEDNKLFREASGIPRISDGMLQLLQSAWEEGIIEVEFSNDAMEIPGFKVYEW